LTFKTPTKKEFLRRVFLLITFEDAFTSFFKDKKVQKKSQNSRNQGFSYYFCLMIEGSGRPKNMWIRIQNTGEEEKLNEANTIASN
jgi:hypothetical protein